MKTLTRRLTQLTIGIATLALTMTVATPTFARGKATLKVQAVAAGGRVVAVNVANPAPRPIGPTILSRVLTMRGVAALISWLEVASGQTGPIRTALPDTTLDVPPLGVVVDDGVPF